MKSGNEVYFRQRAEHHLARAGTAERHAAWWQRRVAKSYLGHTLARGLAWQGLAMLNQGTVGFEA